MKTILALAFIALLAGAFAHKSKAPLEESKLVASLKGLFQLASQDELEDVAEILAEVRHEIEASLDKVRANYAAEESDYEDVRGDYEQGIADLETAGEQLNAEIEAAQDVADQLTESIESSVAAIEEAQAQQEAEEARRTDYHNAFRAKIDQLNAAVEAAEDALRLLEEIDTQDLSGSFLEINNKKIKTHFETVHKTLHGMKLATSVSPLTKMLVEVASAGINHDLIAQLEDLLNQLIEILNSEVNAAVTDDNNDDEYSRSTLANLQSTIDTQSDAAERNQASLDEINWDIEYAQGWLEWVVETIEWANEQLDELNAAWDIKSANYDALIKRLRRDIEALEAAENFVDRDDE